ncbi:MAG: hypothetical protein GEV06_16400 [Luteitalea sp.]|nr:hypothetical protein [Luteitalea sp.]
MNMRASVRGQSPRRVQTRDVDVPDTATELQAWLQSAGFRIRRPFIRLYRGAWSWPRHSNCLFVIMGPELG